jgi:hypothetical protein
MRLALRSEWRVAKSDRTAVLIGKRAKDVGLNYHRQLRYAFHALSDDSHRAAKNFSHVRDRSASSPRSDAAKKFQHLSGLRIIDDIQTLAASLREEFGRSSVGQRKLHWPQALLPELVTVARGLGSVCVGRINHRAAHHKIRRRSIPILAMPPL